MDKILAFYRLAFDHHDFDHNRRMTKKLIMDEMLL
jgi:ribosomal protein S17E